MLSRWSRLMGLAVLVAAPVVGAQIALGRLLDVEPGLAWLAVGAFVLVVVVLILPGALFITALPATYLYYRVGPASTDISLADVMLGIALLAAMPFVPWRSPPLRSMFRVLVAYLLALAVPIAAVFSQRAVVEWGHRAFLVGGGVIVGAAIAGTGRSVRALRAFLAASAIVAVASIYYALAHWGSGLLPSPAYPFGIHKNSAGFLLACALLLMTVAPRIVAVPRALRVPCMVLLFVGLAACQARGSAITLVGALVLWMLHERRVKLSPVMVVGAVLLIAMTYLTLNAAFQSDSKDSAFNSVNSRTATYDASLKLWKRDPLVGVGLKFWRDPALAGETAFGEPHDLVVSALGESGVIGLAGLCLLVGATLVVVGRDRSDLAAAAALIVIAKAVDSLVGIYWVAGTLTIAWIVVGLTCVPRSDQVHQERPPELEAVS